MPELHPGRRRRHRPALLLLVVTALLLAACGSGEDSGGGAPEVERAGDFTLDSTPRTITLPVGERQRDYLLEPAEGLTAGDAPALVVVLHQEGGTPETIAAETGLADLRRRGTTLVYPAGFDSSWDAGNCCGLSQEQGVDDLAFLDAVLADVPRRTPVDPDRQAIVGYSSGAMLTYRYLCGRQPRLSAVVLVSGSLEADCSSSITAPDVLALHGKKDGTIGFTRPIFVARLGLAPRTVVSTLGIFSRSAGCPDAQLSVEPGVEVRRYSGCRGGSSIEALVVPEAGHAWELLDATRRTHDFLVTQLLSRPSA